MRLKLTISDEEGNQVGHNLYFSAPLVLESTRDELETRMLRDLKWAVELLLWRYLRPKKKKDKKIYKMKEYFDE